MLSRVDDDGILIQGRSQDLRRCVCAKYQLFVEASRESANGGGSGGSPPPPPFLLKISDELVHSGTF